MQKFQTGLVTRQTLIHCVVFLLLTNPMNAQAKDKCQLPLKYLKESTQYQTNNNIKQADEFFDIALSLHKLLVKDCDTASYRESINTLINQHSVNQRALCSSGVRRDCFKNTNRITQFGE